MTKFSAYYQQMWEENETALRKFQDAHDTYKANQRNTGAKATFDTVGKEVLEVIHTWDQRLCTQMERGKNGVFSSKVSEKFWAEVKKDFPLIDLVGVEVSFAQ